MKYDNIAEVKDFLDTKKHDKADDTIRSYELSITKFFDYMKIQSSEDIKKVTSKNGRDFQGYLLANKVTKSTTNAYLRPIKVAFNFWLDQEYIESNPFLKVKLLKVEKSIPNYLSESEVNDMLGACNTLEHKLILALMVTTGIRREELTTLEISGIQDNHILVHGKGSKERKLVLAPEILDLLNQYLEYRIKKYGNELPYIFISKWRTKYSGTSIWEKIRKIATDAGFAEDRIKKIHPHITRHTFATNMMESGADIKILQQGLGHSSLKTTSDIYAHVRSSALDHAMLNQKRVLA